jgi:hypothetical protein
LNEAELEVDSEKETYKQKLEVLQEQEELIEDEAEQEEVDTFSPFLKPVLPRSRKRKGFVVSAKKQKGG